MKIAIIGAMSIEIDMLKNVLSNKTNNTFSGTNVTLGYLKNNQVIAAKCNVGKVNSAICAQTIILNYKPDMVINIGVAGGSNNLTPGYAAIAKLFYQHDVDMTVLGEPKGLIDGINKTSILSDKDISNGLLSSALKLGFNASLENFACGDQFLSPVEINKIKEDFDACVFDMESGAIAQTCYISNTPFGCCKVISDSGETKEYNSNKEKSAFNSIDIIKNYIIGI